MITLGKLFQLTLVKLQNEKWGVPDMRKKVLQHIFLTASSFSLILLTGCSSGAQAQPLEGTAKNDFCNSITDANSRFNEIYSQTIELGIAPSREESNEAVSSLSKLSDTFQQAGFSKLAKSRKAEASFYWASFRSARNEYYSQDSLLSPLGDDQPLFSLAFLEENAQKNWYEAQEEQEIVNELCQ